MNIRWDSVYFILMGSLALIGLMPNMRSVFTTTILAELVIAE